MESMNTTTTDELESRKPRRRILSKDSIGLTLSIVAVSISFTSLYLANFRVTNQLRATLVDAKTYPRPVFTFAIVNSVIDPLSSPAPM